VKKKPGIKPIRLVRCDECGLERDEAFIVETRIDELTTRICHDCDEATQSRSIHEDFSAYRAVPSRDYRADRGSKH